MIVYNIMYSNYKFQLPKQYYDEYPLYKAGW